MAPPQNILVIMSDQHTPSVLGCYGNSLVRTPNLDRLAREGMRFDNVYCPSPLCVPSRMSYMTGRLPSRNRVWTNKGVLDSGIPTWAHHLGAAGYDTALIGRMHFLGPDQRHGFIERPIGEGAARFPGAPEAGGPTYNRIPVGTAGQKRICFEYAGRGPNFFQHYDAQVVDSTCQFLRQHADAERPFIAHAGGLLPHCPFIGPVESFDYYFSRLDPSPEFDETEEPACIQSLLEFRNLKPPATKYQLRVALAAYYAMCEYLDSQIGRILDVLDETGLSENTLVLYCSDHGEMGGEHGLWAKKCFYEDAARVPLIARWPGVVEPGTVNNDICSLIDLAPTFTEIAGVEETDFDGKSLMSLLRGGSEPERSVISEVVDFQGQKTTDLLWLGRMIRQGSWKLWQHTSPEGEQWEPVLFNVQADPGERTNLNGEPASSEVLQDLLEEMNHGWHPEQVTAEIRQQVRDLQVLRKWGKSVQPTHPDTYRWPGPEIEEEIELLSSPS